MDISANSGRTIKRRQWFGLKEKQTILKAAGEPGAAVSEVSRQYGVGRSPIHNWRRQQAVAALGATVVLRRWRWRRRGRAVERSRPSWRAWGDVAEQRRARQ